MDDLLTRFWTDLIGRLTGPLTLRLLLQPAIAILLATRDGIKDARGHRPPYFWSLFTHPEERRRALRDGWKSIAKVFVMATTLDIVYQLIVFRWVYPIETLTVAFLLACVPYLLMRGPLNRLARLWIHPPRAAA